MKKLIVFDLDDTLTESKQAMDNEMSSLLCDLLKDKKVAVISGASFEQFKKQFVDILPCSDLSNLYLFPTNGGSMFRWDLKIWNMVYKDFLSESQKEKIINTLKDAVKNISPEKVYGKQIEDRESQITFSALGQEAPLEKKRKWDPDKSERQKIVELIKNELDEFNIYITGTTSIDITKKGIDKAYGIRKIMRYVEAETEEVLFVGDAIESGNDNSVKDLGIDYKEVSGVEKTKEIVRGLLN